MYEHLKKEYYDNEYYDYDKYDKYYKYGKKNIEESLEKTNEETLEGIPIAEIEKFLRKKKLEKLGNK